MARWSIRTRQAIKHSLRLVCDAPEDGEALAPGDPVRGWAMGPDGVREVEIWLDGEVIGHAELGRARPDVAAAYPEMSGALHSGFRFVLPALPPPLPRNAELRLVAQDSAGRRAEVTRRVEAVSARVQPMAGSLDIPVLRAPGDPLREVGWSNLLVLFGWAVDVKGIDRIEVLLDGQIVGEGTHGLPREDVDLYRPHYRSLGLAARSGWLAIIPTEGFAPGRHEVSAFVYGRSGTLRLGPNPVWLRAESVRADPVRRERMEALLRCPKCGGPLARSGGDLACGDCGTPARSNEFGTLLLEETYAGLDWREAGFTSHGYPQEAVDVIMECRDGLVLDIGAGMRENLPNVIQLDAIPFPTTDISANAEALPFADQSFDGVIACNLLEHVSDPQAVIREVRRVCKLGGRIYMDMTSVHPYHGFPHHYFNATETGLGWLMREVGGASGTVDTDDARITLRLILEQWLAGLEDVEAREFAQALTLGGLLDLLREPRRDPARYEALGRLSANARRLIPPKVTFTGVRVR